MPYTALPDRRISFDNDGTVVYQGTQATGGVQVASGATLISWNGTSFANAGYSADTGGDLCVDWFYFPEQREITAFYIVPRNEALGQIAGSNDTTNGLDGTWEVASLTGGVMSYTNNFAWRAGIKPISFTGGKRTARFTHTYNNSTNPLTIAHIYGQKTVGQTPDDILFLDPTAADAEFAIPIDFGDRPLATTVVKQFKVKNASATKTANTINIQCNDADFAISTDNATWVVTINIGSLAAAAKSNVMYIRNTTAAVGNLIGPRFARIVVTVASYT